MNRLRVLVCEELNQSHINFVTTTARGHETFNHFSNHFSVHSSLPVSCEVDGLVACNRVLNVTIAPKYIVGQNTQTIFNHSSDVSRTVENKRP